MITLNSNKLLFKRLRRLFIPLIAILLIVLFGTIGYMYIENYTLLEALFMTVITIGTVGYGIVKPLDTHGMVFTILLIVLGLGVFTYSITLISTFIIEGELKSYFTNYRQQSEIKKMKNHVIICGCDRNGHQVVTELTAHKRQFVIIEQDENVIKSFQDTSLIFIHGDATNEDVLIEAGVQSAKAIIITLPNDANNLFVTITARSLNKNIKIVSRASQESTEKKLRIAGANNVVMPERVGGIHMATLVMKPDVVEFLQKISAQDDNSALTNLEEIVCSELPEELKNKTINDLDIRRKAGANIIGFKTAEGEYMVNPSADTILMPGSKLFVLGTPNQITIMKKILKMI